MHSDLYKKINDRFDLRSQVLRELGFKYVLLQEYGFDAALFTRPRLGHKIAETIQASFVMHADSFFWDEKVGELKQAA